MRVQFWLGFPLYRKFRDHPSDRSIQSILWNNGVSGIPVICSLLISFAQEFSSLRVSMHSVSSFLPECLHLLSLNLPMDWNAQLLSRILLVITFWKCPIGFWRSMAPNRGYQDSCQEAHVDLKECFWLDYRNPPAEIRAWATHPQQTDDTANARASRKQGSRGGCITSASMRKVFINETVY